MLRKTRLLRAMDYGLFVCMNVALAKEDQKKETQKNKEARITSCIQAGFFLPEKRDWADA